MLKLALYAYVAYSNAKDLLVGRTPARDKGRNRMASDPEGQPVLMDFRGRYGRLCRLSCQALVNSPDKKVAIIHAFNGDNSGPFDPELSAIRRAWVDTNAAMLRAREHNPTGAVVRAALEARTAVEQEWGVELPARAGV